MYLMDQATFLNIIKVDEVVTQSIVAGFYYVILCLEFLVLIVGITYDFQSVLIDKPLLTDSIKMSDDKKPIQDSIHLS